MTDRQAGKRTDKQAKRQTGRHTDRNKIHTHTRPPARTHARTHASTHARTHTHTHKHTHTPFVPLPSYFIFLNGCRFPVSYFVCFVTKSNVIHCVYSRLYVFGPHTISQNLRGAGTAARHNGTLQSPRGINTSWSR